MKKILIVLLVVSTILFAESSYYSQNGLGLTSNILSVRAQGLGNTGGAVMDSISLTSSNPAFWYNFQTTSLQGLMNYSTQSSDKLDEGFRSSGLGGFAMKFPVGEYIGVVLGLSPQYRTDYNTNNIDSVEFDGNYIKFANESKYSGGISEAFLGFGYKFGSRLSLGLKTKLLFGNYDYVNTTDKSDNGIVNATYSEKLEMRGLQSELGIGWYQPNNFSIGLSYTMNNYFSCESKANYKLYTDYYRGPDVNGIKQEVALPEKFTASLQKKLFKQFNFISLG